jgi:hypothetical protein
LLDARAVAYFDSLGALLQQGWPELLGRMLASEERSASLSSSLERLERRGREVELASRPFVEERVAMLSAKLLLLEKGVLKKLRAEVRRVEQESREKAAKEKEMAAQSVGVETSLARVHYRCVACDQVVNAQPGPLSKELIAQLAHQHGHHSLPHAHGHSGVHHTTVAGFASALPASNSSMLALPSGSGNNASGSGSDAHFVSSERGHLFVDPGTRITLHAHSGSEVFRGREDARVSFTQPARAASATEPAINGGSSGGGAHAKSASFHLAYGKTDGGTVIPSGTSLPRSAGGRTGAAAAAVATGRHHVSASSDSVNLPRIQLSQTQPLGGAAVSGASSARSASAVPKVPQHQPSGSQSHRNARPTRPAAIGGTAAIDGETKEE